jgi:hypothetical protein
MPHEFRQILGRRVVQNQIQYYVEWLDGTFSWESHFDILSTEAIKEFETKMTTVKAEFRHVRAKKREFVKDLAPTIGIKEAIAQADALFAFPEETESPVR